MSKIMMALLAILFLSACGTESAGPPEQDLPELTVGLEGEDHTAAHGSYCWTEGGTSTCADASGNPFDYEPFSGIISARAGAEAELVFSHTPQSARISFQPDGHTDAEKTPGLFRVPDKPGRYGYTIFAQWPEGDVSYFFIIEAE
ncbi:MAG: hypothetical protein ACI33O_09140 [Bhargavaea sp.]